MGARPAIYSSVSGPAKWAAVVALTAICSAGLTYSLMREPRGGKASAPAVKELPPRQVVTKPVPPPVVLQPQVPVVAPPVLSLAVESVAARVEPSTPAPVETLAPALATPGPESSPPPQPAASVARKININTATQAELELLPRIGPAMAKAIISHRSLHGPFRSVQELDKVKGIGPKTLERLALLVTVD